VPLPVLHQMKKFSPICQKTLQTCSYAHPMTNLICDICFNPCESCLCWQHGTCMGLYEDNVPHNYICYYCRQTCSFVRLNVSFFTRNTRVTHYL
uniref:Zinc finger PHD-type domain-containing protein n=1 Tax=Acanthochromis polyacanthus TaxID=80966 RepID=A0A3Q1G3Z9_9TELE